MSAEPQAPTPGLSREATTALAGVGAVAVVMIIVLRSMGRVLWCQCGTYVPWSFEIWSQHNSQHIIDPYAFTHVLHGVTFYALTRLVLGRGRLPTRAAIAVSLEAVWEVVENSEWIIQKYREATISLDYYGDSIANSTADLGFCALGFLIASRLPTRVSIGFFVAVELFLAWWIRDSLLLNVLMLVYPLEAVKTWQMGLGG